MKILQTPVRLFANGGVESYVRSLSKELVGLGHDVRVICADTPGENEVDGTVEATALRTIGKLANTSITPYLPLALLNEDFDVLHTHLPTPWSADWSSIVSKLKGKPLVLTYHSDITGKGLARHIAAAYNFTALKFLLRNADRIIVTRQGYLSKHLGGQKKKIAIIPIGVDSRAFRPVPTQKKGDIFFLSVLDDYHGFKGLDVLLGAMRIAIRDMPDLRLIVGGDGSTRIFYEDESRSMGLSRNVEFVGSVPQERLTEYYNGCSLFVLPSTDPGRETFGIVLLEAMACGIPVIATEIAGPAEAIRESGAGLVVPPGNKKMLAEAIIRILGNRDLSASMGIEGRRLAEKKYNWRRIAEQTAALYEELI
jgi:glycosyltransferase involved in cell wall biosynthesis